MAMNEASRQSLLTGLKVGFPVVRMAQVHSGQDKCSGANASVSTHADYLLCTCCTLLPCKQGVSRRQLPGEIAAAATSHSLPSLGGSTHALSDDARVAPMS